MGLVLLVRINNQITINRVHIQNWSFEIMWESLAVSCNSPGNLGVRKDIRLTFK